MHELVFCVPGTGKYATFAPNARKRFEALEHAITYGLLAKNTPPLGMYFTIMYGTRADVQRNALGGGVDALDDDTDDMGEVPTLYRFELALFVGKQEKKLNDMDPLRFITRERAVRCARFIERYGVPDDKVNIMVNEAMQKLHSPIVEANMLTKHANTIYRVYALDNNGGRLEPPELLAPHALDIAATTALATGDAATERTPTPRGRNTPVHAVIGAVALQKDMHQQTRQQQPNPLSVSGNKLPRQPLLQQKPVVIVVVDNSNGHDDDSDDDDSEDGDSEVSSDAENSDDDALLLTKLGQPRGVLVAGARRLHHAIDNGGDSNGQMALDVSSAPTAIK